MRRIVRARDAAMAALAMALGGCLWPMPDQNPDRTSYNSGELTLKAENVSQLRMKWVWSERDGERTWGTVMLPVVSEGGVHFTKGCYVGTLDPGNGKMRWTHPAAPWNECPQSGATQMWSSEPYVMDTPNGPRVISSRVTRQQETSTSFIWDWRTSVIDAQSGRALSNPPFDFVSAARGDKVVGLSAARNGYQVDLNIVSYGTMTSTERRFYISATNEHRGQLTAGTDLVFHSGPGALTTTPGPTTQGLGVRAFSRTTTRSGCIVTVPEPLFDRSVECPVWANPLADLPPGTPLTAPVIGQDGAVLYVVAAGTLYALDAGTGATLWTAAGAGGQPALADGTLFVPTDDGQVVTYPAGGCGAPACEPVTHFDTQSGGDTSDPALAADVLYVTVGGTLYAFGRSGCPGNWCTPLVAVTSGVETLSAPIVAQGQVYTTANNTIMGYGLP